MTATKYCASLSKTVRTPKRTVYVGNVPVGGGHPIRIQSMTTSSTRDVDATVEQIIKLADKGCEIARVTVQGMKEAYACEEIKNSLIQKGYTIPLVADIHFYPPAAMSVIDFVDKVRINPGNFADKRASFKTLEYDDVSYQLEIEKIEEKFTPLVEKCKKLNKTMRIGTNHGSLSDRIMNRYGDTAAGMVESALEYARICRKHDFHNIIFSMKASNTIVMIQAYRLLEAAMQQLGWDYPLHLGVTEAGEGEDGRIKSAIGMGSLLLDGIGDTIRVSLTEDPWMEIDPCQRLIALAKKYEGEPGIAPYEEKLRSIEERKVPQSNLTKSSFLHRDGSVVLAISPEELKSPNFFEAIGCSLDDTGAPEKSLDSADALYLEALPTEEQALKQLNTAKELGIGILSPFPFPGGQLTSTLNDKEKGSILILKDEEPKEWEKIKETPPSLILLQPSTNRPQKVRRFFEWLYAEKLDIPVILSFSYKEEEKDLIIHSAAEAGGLLCDALGSGIMLTTTQGTSFNRRLAFNILQGARMRTTKTEFISCPGCGRTLFDLQDVAATIRKRTDHLPGVKIAIMGCIVNGPGEMADADFGYVGSRPGKIDLYVGKECVEKNIDFADAEEQLVALIKRHNRWVEPQKELVTS